MAVVQISKIQVRRGQKNSNSGVPQLSSAEFAWAVDTQELFIGNGSVQEGAPYVGNTKVLTEHDNIIELASSYRFASTDPSITESVSRSLGGKIDEIEVSVVDFGAVGDGSTDCTSAFETALTQLFRNSNNNFKKVLAVPNGTYLFLSDLDIPSNAIIRGETKENTILEIGTNNIQFTTSDGLARLDFTSSNRPTNVDISNITISRTTGQTDISGLVNSEFRRVKFIGEYELGNVVDTFVNEPAAVVWENANDGTKVNHVKFKECDFEQNSISLKCTQTAKFITEIRVEDCIFFVGDTAIYIAGVTDQENKWQISHCQFNEIGRTSFRSTNGTGTLIQSSDFKNCGNETNTASNPVHPIVFFNQSSDNLVIDCTSDRQQSAGLVATATKVAIPEVHNAELARFLDKNYGHIYLSDAFRPIAVFAAENRNFTINYTLRLSTYSRHGQIMINIDENLSSANITDHFSYSTTDSTSSGGSIMTNFEFNVELRDNNSDSQNETIVLFYKNPLLTGADGTMSFDVEYGV